MARFVAFGAALTWVSEAAYDCAGSDPAYKLKAAADTIYCSPTVLGSCPSAMCCELDTTKCSGADPCAEGKTYTKGATGKNAAECCIVDKALCSTHTCPGGYKAKTGTLFCAGVKCGANDDATCCDADQDKCLFFQEQGSCAAGKYVPTANYDNTGITSDACGCTANTCAVWKSANGADACGATKYMPNSKAATTGNDVATCCDDMPVCSKIINGFNFCDHIETIDGFKDVFFETDATKANTSYNPDVEDKDWLNEVKKCCKLKSTFCMVAFTGSCPTGKVFFGARDLKDNGTVFTIPGTTADFCCIDDTTCAEYEMPTTPAPRAPPVSSDDYDDESVTTPPAGTASDAQMSARSNSLFSLAAVVAQFMACSAYNM